MLSVLLAARYLCTCVVSLPTTRRCVLFFRDEPEHRQRSETDLEREVNVRVMNNVFLNAEYSSMRIELQAFTP